jgi:hypothetical protein
MLLRSNQTVTTFNNHAFEISVWLANEKLCYISSIMQVLFIHSPPTRYWQVGGTGRREVGPSCTTVRVGGKELDCQKEMRSSALVQSTGWLSQPSRARCKRLIFSLLQISFSLYNPFWRLSSNTLPRTGDVFILKGLVRSTGKITLDHEQLALVP